MLYQHWKEVVTLTDYAVELKNVCKRFPLPTGGELEACKNINITLEKGAVSYTHLDVYKRQLFGILIRLIIYGFIDYK